MSDNGTAVNKPTTSEAASPPAAAETSPTAAADNRKTPKRTPSKRRSFIERAQEESEELVRTMGGSLELEGGRRTRSSTRGTPIRAAATVQLTPPPTKKARSSPLAAPATPKTPRSRARKQHDVAQIDAEETPVDEEEEEIVKTEVEQESAESEKPTETKLVNNDNGTKESVTTTENEKPSADVGEKSSEDKTDAVCVSPAVPEDQQNNIDHEKIVKKAGPEKAEEPVPAATAEEDAPMETDEPANLQRPEEVKSEKITKIKPAIAAEEAKPSPGVVADKEKEKEKEVTVEAPKAAETPAAVVVKIKEPTPEPMEVDSSSNTNHAVEPAKTVDAELPAHKNPVEIAATATSEVKGNSNTEAETKTEKASAPKAAGNANATINELSKEVVKASNNVENDIKSASVVDESAKADKNEMCEPKLANNTADATDGNASTPQACN